MDRIDFELLEASSATKVIGRIAELQLVGCLATVDFHSANRVVEDASVRYRAGVMLFVMVMSRTRALTSGIFANRHLNAFAL